ncbi:LuxR C-terminal-related transcriptional regulator [Variovorax sp. J22R24]|uniref:response regulator transcription factor n=1 Tax=Variovorax gracilis TaxID=3053502 RepID=UPI002575DFAC|nr:LuxR C-terminal-related transcriptional regulator [Variovorax sp. J22R24]MDM0110341.1 LuxR C-terminal-related transcriptional regulator [Variovorax sp. J22R24]
MKVGVSDFLIKPVAEQMLREAIETAVVRGRRQRTRASRIAFLRERYACLTYQEQVVARSVSEGYRNRDIAEKLGAAERTVKSYRKSALKKLVVDSVPDLVHAFAILDSDAPPGGASVETGVNVQNGDTAPDATDRSKSHDRHASVSRVGAPRSR